PHPWRAAAAPARLPPPSCRPRWGRTGRSPRIGTPGAVSCSDAGWREWRSVSVRVGAGISTAADPATGATEAAATAARQLDGRGVDLAVVFAAGAHLAAPQATLDSMHATLSPAVLIGC